VQCIQVKMIARRVCITWHGDMEVGQDLFIRVDARELGKDS